VQNSVLQLLLALSGVGSILGLVFTVGYNWRRVTDHELSLTALIATTLKREGDLITTYVRKDVFESELRALNSKVSYMSKQLNALMVNARVSVSEDT